MQIRRYLATAAGASALIGSGLGLVLAAPASAAPPMPTASPSSSAAQPVPPSAVPTPARTDAPVIAVPAGNAQVAKPGGATDFDLAALFAAGVVLAGAGTVVAIRRRA